MNTATDANPLTHREKAWRAYRAELTALRSPLSAFPWTLLLTIRQGSSCQHFEAFTNLDDRGYLERETVAKRVIGQVRADLGLTRREIHYYLIHEFGRNRCGHLHIPIQLTKHRSYAEINKVFKARAADWRREGGYQLWHYYKKTKDIFIRSDWRTVDYLCKEEKHAFDSHGSPLWKRPTPSKYLEEHGTKNTAPSLILN